MQRRSRKYQITYEVLNTVTHGLGFVLAILAGIFLLVHIAEQDPSPLELTAILIYIISISLFLLASTLFHALVFTRAAKVFQFLDHAGIYLVILGSYTPYTWLFIHGWVGWAIWGMIAAMTVAGLIYDFFWVGRWPWVSVVIYLVMGWMILLAMPILWGSLSHLAFWLLLAGGVVYSLGTIFYLIPKIPMGHVYWHMFVLLGAGLMYVSVYLSL
ncbi:hemolysin III family protein [Leuconostocaceae bacterium ESL0723]|nr:hemolysin III family protein [Leuconostocaceae bacterium ESL0723]